MSTTQSELIAAARQELAASGNLRVAVNLSNFLLLSTSNAKGEPEGVSTAVAARIADELGVTLQVIPYQGPGLIADAASNDEWDLANIAAEPERAKHIHFSPAYCEIQAAYLLPPDSTLQSIADVDQPGHRIAVKERSAYDLWLTANLQHATLHRAPSLDASFELFSDEQLDALAGLRPKLIEQQALMPGSVLLDESFTAVQQSIGCKPGLDAAAAYLSDFVNRAQQSGLITDLIEHYGVSGRLSPAQE